jgi:hypothetical protein
MVVDPVAGFRGVYGRGILNTVEFAINSMHFPNLGTTSLNAVPTKIIKCLLGRKPHRQRTPPKIRGRTFCRPRKGPAKTRETAEGGGCRSY